MKRKLLGTFLFLTLALGHCQPYQCTPLSPPSQCRGTIGPKPPAIVRPFR